MFDYLEEETFETVKGNYKTIIVCKFNHKGYLVSHSVVTTLVIDEIHSMLKDALVEAFENKDYDEMARIQDLINRKRDGEQIKSQQIKPT